MHVLLFNCPGSTVEETTELLQISEVNVYLAVSQSDVLRILNSTRIDVAVLSIPDLEKRLLKLLHSFTETQFYLYGAPPASLASYKNLHAVNDGSYIPAFRNFLMPHNIEATS